VFIYDFLLLIISCVVGDVTQNALTPIMLLDSRVLKKGNFVRWRHC